MKKSKRREVRDGLDLLEEAFHLIRMASVTTWVVYAVGVIPFVAFLLFYIADMSRSAFAVERCAPGAFILTLLFIWMKCWQSVFCSHLHASVTDQPLPKWTWRRWLRLVPVHAALSTTGILIWPIAAAVMAPIGWVNAFYQNLTAMYADRDYTILSAWKRAGTLSRTDPGQNMVSIFIFSVFGMAVFFNVATALAYLPFLLKMLLGIETAFTRNIWWIFSTSFTSIAAVVTFVCIDPLHKSMHVLRCFYGDAIYTGEDLRVAVRRFSSLRRMTAVILVSMISVEGLAVPSHAEEAYAYPLPDMTAAEVQSVDAEQLDGHVSDTLTKPEYAWRLPRDNSRIAKEKEPGLLTHFMDAVASVIKDAVKAVADFFGDAMDWLQEKLGFKPKPRAARDADFDWLPAMHATTWILLAILCSVIAITFYRAWRQRVRSASFAQAEIMTLQPDLDSEDTLASALPEDEWIRMAEEMMQRGDLRRAMRAYFLAMLAFLSHVELITISRSKSNREYQRELVRRARATPEIPPVFEDSIWQFERSWYGLHEVAHSEIATVRDNLGKMRAYAQT